MGFLERILEHRRPLFAICFSLLTGWLDAYCLRFFGAFAGMQTGNFLTFSLDIADGDTAHAMLCLESIMCNILGVATYNVLSKNRSFGTIDTTVFCGPLFFAALLLADIVASTQGWDWSGGAKHTIGFLSFGMGIQNAFTNGPKRDVKVMTSFVTGNLHKVVNTLTDRIILGKSTPAAMYDVVVALATIVGLTLGALLGAHWDSKVSKKWMMTPAGAWFLIVGMAHDYFFGHFGEILREPKESNEQSKELPLAQKN